MRGPLLVVTIGCLFGFASSQIGTAEDSPIKDGTPAGSRNSAPQPAGNTEFLIGTVSQHENLTIFPIM